MTVWLLVLIQLMAVLVGVEADRKIEAQPGPQASFLWSTANIAITGGGAGGGKSYGLLLSAGRYVRYRNFTSVIFRREYPQIMAEGGLWDSSREIFPYLRGIPREIKTDWRFPGGARVRFSHMQREEDRFAWDGSQICMIGFDQLESFEKSMFFYLLSRNRTSCGIVPHIRATCNPINDHWLKDFLKCGGRQDLSWIDEDGWARPERSGKLAWFIQQDDRMEWAATAEELIEQFGADVAPKSVTFIHSSIMDNKIFLARNPEYLATLKALPMIDRLRLLGDIQAIERGGNWNVSAVAGMFFQKSWFEVVSAPPADMELIRYWDRAATPSKPGEKSDQPADPRRKKRKSSYTAGVLIGKSKTGVFYICDVIRFKGTPATVETTIQNTASQDGHRVRIGIEQDPGQAGVAEAQYQVKGLAGYNVTINRVSESKGTRAKPLSAQVEAGNVKIVAGNWNRDYLDELVNFDGTDNCIADQTDATSGGFHLHTNSKRAGTFGGDDD